MTSSTRRTGAAKTPVSVRLTDVLGRPELEA
jgi:hypothetical protein